MKNITINPTTIIDISFNVNSCPDFLTDTLENVASFADAVLIDRTACEEDIEAWEADARLLEQYGVAEIYSVSTVIGCFTEEEQKAICDYVAESGLAEACNIYRDDFWRAIRYDTSWVDNSEITEDDDIIISGESKSFVWCH